MTATAPTKSLHFGDCAVDCHVDVCPNCSAAVTARYQAAARAKAAEYLAAPLGAVFGDLKVNGGGWSAKTVAMAGTVAEVGTVEWFEALGTRQLVTLTGDGRGVFRGRWCNCPADPPAQTWVRYEAWSAQGREAHGFACPNCRRVTQTG